MDMEWGEGEQEGSDQKWADAYLGVKPIKILYLLIYCISNCLIISEYVSFDTPTYVSIINVSDIKPIMKHFAPCSAILIIKEVESPLS